ncbi:MAG: retropepsin-like aspartic protease [Candidatus Omnitrophota bacterium]
MVYLKNGNNIEGIIEKEDKNALTLNIGCGKISLLKKDVKHIDIYSFNEQNSLKERWNSAYFMRPEFIPDDLKGLAGGFTALEILRIITVKNKKEKDKAAKKVTETEIELNELNANLAGVSDKLTRARPEDNLTDYNSLVNGYNSLVAKIKLAEYNKEALQKEVVALDKKISGYINDFSEFRERFRKTHDALKKEAREQYRYFFEGVDKKLNTMDNDFTRHTISYNRYGSSIIVETLLNGTIRANLILDTGSTFVVISKELANKLGLDINQNSPIFITLADGRNINALAVILESVKVKDVEVKNVRAAVLENKEGVEEDGLLGMSFLENFLFSIDAKANKIILQSFNPP